MGYEFIKDKSGEFVDVLQCNNAPSTRTPRGHQFPAAFMLKVSGMTSHQVSSDKPLKYSHLDVAGSSGNLPGPTTGSCSCSSHAFLKIGAWCILIIALFMRINKFIISS